jgi:cystathionine beta-synthase
VALTVAREVDDPHAFVVTFLCDTGERYLSKLYNDEWMRENQMLDPEKVSLGQLMTLKSGDLPALVATTAGAPVRQALRLMSLHDVSQLAVMDGGTCVGSVSEATLSTRALENTKLLDAVVSDVMDPPFPTVDHDTAIEPVTKMLTKANHAVLVRTKGTITGILTRSDVLHFLMSR